MDLSDLTELLSVFGIVKSASIRLQAVHMISTSKEYKARVEVQIRLSKFKRGLARKVADSICSAIIPEIESVDCDQKIGIGCSNTLIQIEIYTNDHASIRAIFNSYMTYMLTAYSCIRLSL